LVRGNVDKLNLFDEICKAMTNPKPYCNAIIAEDNPENWNIDLRTGNIKELIIEDETSSPL